MTEDDKPNAIFHHQERSKTASTVGNVLFEASGVMTYRVRVAGGMGMQTVDVDAATGDEAADKALAQFPGCKVAHVEPAPPTRKKAA